MDRLVEVVNKLQDTLSSLGSRYIVDLPQIAVVGGQSAGKSSVLECCVGKDFLPRGSGIVTRRPLILQLITHSGQEYGEFAHKPNVKFYNFDDVRKEIEAETDRVTGKNKNISPIPIRLRVFSPNVVTITLVDLPGLTRIAIGDQPKDIDKQITSMVTEYISNPNCIILAVTPANVDLANSDALMIAKTVDPQGLRTIGVVTKIDLMDRGTNCREILLNITYPLKRGFVGVVNRSQADIDGNMDIAKAQMAERAYFLSQDAYKDIADRCGSRYLQEMLSLQLSNHIKSVLPSIKQNLMKELLDIEGELSKFDVDSDSPQNMAKRLMLLIQDFNDEIEKGLGFKNELVNTEELSIGAKINRIINERFPYEMRKLKPPIATMRREICFAIKNAQGVRTSVFTPDAAFTTVCRKKIEEIRPIAQAMLCKITEELRMVIEQACLSKISKYINLLDEVKMSTLRELIKYENDAKDQINLMINFEACHINTKHPEFIPIVNAALRSNLKDEDGGSDLDDVKAQVESYSKGRVLRKGYLSTPSSGLFKNNKEVFVVVKGESIEIYTSESEQKLKYSFDIRNCFCRSGKHRSFQIIKSDGSNIAKDMKYLEFSASNDEEAEDWKATLMAAGVYPDSNVDRSNKHNDSKKTPDGSSDSINMIPGEEYDPLLYHQVEIIRLFIETYTKIVIKTQTDMIGKIVIYMVVNKLRSFCHGELIAYLYSLDKLEKYLSQSEEEVRRKDELLKIQKCLKRATNVINEVISSGPSIMNNTNNYSVQKNLEADKSLRKPSSTSSRDVSGNLNLKTLGSLRKLPQRPSGV